MTSLNYRCKYKIPLNYRCKYKNPVCNEDNALRAQPLLPKELSSPTTHTLCWKENRNIHRIQGLCLHHRSVIWRCKRPDPDRFLSLSLEKTLTQSWDKVLGDLEIWKGGYFMEEWKTEQKWIHLTSTLLSCELRIIKEIFLPSLTVFHRGIMKFTAWNNGKKHA